MIGIERDGARFAERVHAEFAGGADHFHLLVFRVAFSFNPKIDGHAEGIHVLRHFAHNAEAFLRAEHRIGELELRRAAGLEPLQEEIAEILAGGLLHHFPKSSLLADLKLYWSMNALIPLKKAWSPTTPRSMLKTAAPLAAVRAQNSGE